MESYFRGVRIFCTAVYCLWAVMLTQDGCHSLTWDPSVTYKINEIFWP